MQRKPDRPDFLETSWLNLAPRTTERSGHDTSSSRPHCLRNKLDAAISAQPDRQKAIRLQLPKSATNKAAIFTALQSACPAVHLGHVSRCRIPGCELSKTKVNLAASSDKRCPTFPLRHYLPVLLQSTILSLSYY